MAFLFNNCWASQAYADDFLTVFREVGPDLLLIDVALFSVMAAAAELGTPRVRVDHSIYLPKWLDLTDFTDNETGAALNRAVASFETLPLVLAPSYAAFNPSTDFGPAVRHVGPIREVAHPRPWPRRFPERPLVLASLSTSFQDQAETLQRICDALSSLEIEALVTTGPAMPPEEFRAASHVDLRRFTPHDEVLPFADLAITHCGHGTVMACAGCGSPMLCMPMGRDQHFVASRVEALGLGAVLDHTATPTGIADAVSAMLADPAWKHVAGRFAASVPRFGELELAATLVEQAAAGQCMKEKPLPQLI